MQFLVNPTRIIVQPPGRASNTASSFVRFPPSFVQKRVRLAPSERQALILDHVAEIVAREGVSALSTIALVNFGGRKP
jgi:hypothetical protein